MSEPTREQIEALAHVLDRPHGKRDAITTNPAIAQDAALRIFAAGYAPPERLREVEAERDALAAKLAEAEHRRELAREARDNWERLYRAACWLPDSDHVARRMEDIAAKAVEAVIERDAARARVRELEGGS